MKERNKQSVKNKFLKKMSEIVEFFPGLVENYSPRIIKIDEENGNVKFGTARDLLIFGLIIVLSSVLITLITAAIKDIIFPPVSYLLNKINVPDWKIVISKPCPSRSSQTTKASVSNNDTQPDKEIAIRLGDFIETALVALIVGAITLFFLLRVIRKK